jgi:hypothetical protein
VIDIRGALRKYTPLLLRQFWAGIGFPVKSSSCAETYALSLTAENTPDLRKSEECCFTKT